VHVQFFMKTGECSFGPTCRFNHPPNRVPSVISRPSSIVAAAVKLSLAGRPRREVKYTIVTVTNSLFSRVQ
jgi:hypothetical protein